MGMIFCSNDLYLGIARMTGRHKIAGTVTVDGQPAKRLVAAFDRRTMSLVAVTSSDPVTGAWEISGVGDIGDRNILAVAFDTTGNYNAEVADYITQVTTVEQ
jgi:hypothetical protein